MQDLIERSKKGWDTAKTCLPSALVSGLGMVTSYAVTKEGHFALVGNAGGLLHCIDVESSRRVCTLVDPDFGGSNDSSKVADPAATPSEPITTLAVVATGAPTGPLTSHARYWLTVTVASPRRVKVSSSCCAIHFPRASP